MGRSYEGNISAVVPELSGCVCGLCSTEAVACRYDLVIRIQRNILREDGTHYAASLQPGVVQSCMAITVRAE